MSHSNVRVRFAPSPTGLLHIGGLRTALYNQFLARQQAGDFILRIEDTDQTRFVPGSIESICRSLEAVGVIPNEGVWLNDKQELIERGERGPYLQSKRKAQHQRYARQLVELDKAYYCFCSAKRLEELRQAQHLVKQPTMYDGRCRAIPLPEALKRLTQGESHIIRLKLPKTGRTKIKDAIHDEVEFAWANLDDQVILKSDGFPTYHLAATCDDHDMGITHVLRGEEWLPSTPKHVFIYEALGWTPPLFAHLPLLLNPDRSKLSKRQVDVSVEDYLKLGYLPEALINFVALLGWNPTADREVYTQTELIQLFDLSKINKSGAVFNVDKLKWLNAHYLRTLPVERYLELTSPLIADLTDDHTFADRCLLLVRERVQFPQEVVELTSYLFKPELDYSKVSLAWKNQTMAAARERLVTLREFIASLSEQEFIRSDASLFLENQIKAWIEQWGWSKGEVLWPLRVALAGSDKSPTPFELLYTYGKDKSLKRLTSAIKSIV